MLALIENLGGIELLIVLIAALLVFGRRLPEVAAQAGKQLVKIRRSLDSAWRDTGMEREIREARHDIESAIPRNLSIGEMARLASAEMEKRTQANEGSAPTRSDPEAQTGKDQGGSATRPVDG